jgi:hypothetical protein
MIFVMFETQQLHPGCYFVVLILGDWWKSRVATGLAYHPYYVEVVQEQ